MNIGKIIAQFETLVQEDKHCSDCCLFGNTYSTRGRAQFKLLLYWKHLFQKRMNLAQIVAQLETLVPKEEEHTVVQIIAQLEALVPKENEHR